MLVKHAWPGLAWLVADGPPPKPPIIVIPFGPQHGTVSRCETRRRLNKYYRVVRRALIAHGVPTHTSKSDRL